MPLSFRSSPATLLVLCAILGLSLSPAAHSQLGAQLVASGFTSPILVIAPPGDFTRIFVVQQNGVIEIVENGAILSPPFLDIRSLVGFGGERGLLGMAFHPSYATNGLFFVHYSGLGGETVLARYSVSANPDIADASSALVFLTETQPFTNHNGGMLAFRPGDSGNYLYMALGDGGSGGDPGNRAQNLGTILGKLLRIDVDGGAPASAPLSNPFVGIFGDDLIWTYGLRNPWRFSFDRATGDLYIGDVGQGIIEEVDFQPASSAGGENYGWRLLEGSNDFNCGDCPGARASTDLPIHEYTHSDGFSVIGGYVYRGSAITGVTGRYFFGDLNGRVWSFVFDGSTVSDLQEHTADFAISGLTLSSFGEDGLGELYVIDLGGRVFKIFDPNAGVQTVFTGGGGVFEEGRSTTLSVVISGVVAPLGNFQWKKNGVPIPGATQQTLFFPSLAIGDAGSYTLQFNDASKGGPFESDPVVVTVFAFGTVPAAGPWALALLGVLIGVMGALRLRTRRP